MTRPIPLLDRVRRAQQVPERPLNEQDSPVPTPHKTPASALLGDPEAVEQELHDRLFRTQAVARSVFHRAGS
ncbi:MAG: hypothetical protein U0800_24625 [Isosphaeraceae bacterium]